MGIRSMPAVAGVSVSPSDIGNRNRFFLPVRCRTLPYQRQAVNTRQLSETIAGKYAVVAEPAESTGNIYLRVEGVCGHE